MSMLTVSKLDLHSNVHSEGHFEGDTREIVTRLHDLYGNFGNIEGTQMQHSFMDLADNDCRYYTHVRNSLIAKRLAQKFVDNSCSSTIGFKFRKTILETGLSKDAEVPLREFLEDGSEGDIKRWIEI